MKHAIRLGLLAGAVALAGTAQAQGQSQEPPKYQSVAPKKAPPKPADPADVATLTGRPVPASVAAKPQPKDPAEYEHDPKVHPGAPLNPDDVDVLTGKYDSQRNPAYQPYDIEGLWALEWMERNGYGPGDSFSVRDGFRGDRVFVPGVFGNRRFGHGRFLHHRHRIPAPVFALRHFLGSGSFFFVFP